MLPYVAYMDPMGIDITRLGCSKKYATKIVIWGLEQTWKMAHVVRCYITSLRYIKWWFSIADCWFTKEAVNG